MAKACLSQHRAHFLLFLVFSCRTDVGGFGPGQASETLNLLIVTPEPTLIHTYGKTNFYIRKLILKNCILSYIHTPVGFRPSLVLVSPPPPPPCFKPPMWTRSQADAFTRAVFNSLSWRVTFLCLPFPTGDKHRLPQCWALVHESLGLTKSEPFRFCSWTLLTYLLLQLLWSMTRLEDF